MGAMRVRTAGESLSGRAAAIRAAGQEPAAWPQIIHNSFMIINL
jgi:hypothetical protein